MRRIVILALATALLILAAVAYGLNVISRTQSVNGQPAGQVLVNDRIAIQFTMPSGGLSASDRSAVVSQRLSDLGVLTASDIISKKVGGKWSVLAKGRNLVTVTSADAAAANQSVTDLALTWSLGLRSAIGGTPVVREGGAGPTLVSDPAPATPIETDQKVVPIISIGSGLRVGAAMVAGEASQVAKVKVVAQIEGEFKGAARLRALVPVESEDVVKNIRRVPGTAVAGLADIKL